jgi:translocation and assembly module TamB
MVRRWVKRAVIFVSVIIILLIGVVLFLHTAIGKSVVQKKLQSFLEEKWNTEVVIQSVDYRLPNWIALEGLTILDAKKDTLLNAGRLYVGIKLLQLLSNKVEITSVILDDINLYCHREKNASEFNFQFIIDAFVPASGDTIASLAATAAPDTIASPVAMAGRDRTPMHFSLNELKLGNLRLSYQDESGKLYFTAFIGRLSALPAALSPGKSEFSLNDFLLQDTDIVMVDSSASGSLTKSDTGNGGAPGSLLMTLGRLRFKSVSFSYKRPFYKTDYSVRVDNMQLREVLFDLAALDINAKSLELSHSSVSLDTWRPSKNETKKVEEKQSNRLPIRNDIKWKFAVKTIDLSDNSFVYQNAGSSKTSGLGFQHIDAQKISLKTTNSSFDSSGFSSDVNSVSLLYNNELNVKKVSGKVRISDSILKVQDLNTAFNQSHLKINGDVNWPLKPAKSVTNSSSFRIDDLSVNYSDLLLIKPDLKRVLPVSLLLSDKIMLSGNFTGTSHGLRAERLTLSTSGRQLHFIAGVELKMEKAGPGFSANFQQLRLKKQLLSKAVLQQLQEQNIQLPEELLLSGRVKLNSQQIVTDLKLNSEFGQLQINGIVKNFQIPRHLSYELALNAQGFETGKWIGLDTAIGKITGNIFVNGKGIEPVTMAATARLQLSSAVINKYPFQNINLQVGLDQSDFKVRSNIQDPNFKTDIDLAGRIDPGYSVHGTIRVKSADLFNMRLTTDSLQYAGNMIVNASYEQPNRINAYLESDSNTVFINGRQISTDRVSLKCYADTDTMVMNFQAPFMDARFAGNYPVDSLASEIAAVWRVIYPLQDEQLGKGDNQYPASYYPGRHRTSLNVVVKPDTLLNAFLPQLKLSQPLTLQARYAYGENESGLGIQLTAPALSYRNIEVRDWQAKAKQTDSIVRFSLTGDQLMLGKKRLTGSEISGQIQKGLLTVKGQVNDSIGRKFYAAHVRVQKETNEIKIHLLDDLTFNRNQWKVSPDNAIRLVEKGVIIHELQLESNRQKIVINTKEQQSSSPIQIRLDSFELRDVFTFLSVNDTPGVSGIINADFSIRQPMEKIPVVTGVIKATNLAMFDTPIGDFQFHSANTGDSLLFNGGLTGANELDFNAGLHLKDNGIYLESHLKKFNLAIVQGFTKDLFAGLSGKITGNLQLAGSLDAPRYKGEIQLDSTKFSLLALNTLYRIDRQKLLINDPDLLLQQFSITDSGGNKLNITGRLGLFSARERTLDLAVEAKDFMLLNAVQKPDVSLYGRGIIDAMLSVKGTVDAPMITGDAYLQKKSQIHLVSGNNSKVMKTRTDGIMFVDIDTIGWVNTSIADVTVDSALKKKKLKGRLNYDLNIKVDKDAQFSMVIDPSTSDELLISGDAHLKAGLLDNGQVGIEGVYNLQSGYYKINNLLLRGKFLLVKGSSISFSGDPSLAEADVTTEYIIEASPKGLLNYKEGDDAAYTQRVPFGVILTMKGPVSKPTLSFDIQLKPGKGVLKSSVKSDVEHALDRLRSDVAEMNKQVFSLLLTKRFSVTSGYNTLESSNLNANNALKEGVSSFLTEAMNQAADQLIKGVDVDVNMKTYKSDDDPISKTDLGVAVSKGVMDDRLVIRIEENFPVGNSSTPVKSGSQYVPDITSTYKLSKDGRLLLKGYQKNEYDAVVQGYFTEIGVNFTIEVSYEKFREILRRRKALADEKK